ncbi:ribbon-helix-helix protein, CopG family [Cetobacterium sp.]|uniref:ribbon-helix-helix protein, CopG family n=1 Tax=Cetobacterium sp. TaxID=2071632 RepID=UPI003F2C55F9
MDKEHINFSNHVITFRIPENLLKKLEKNIKSKKISRSKLIISLLEEHLSDNN